MQIVDLHLDSLGRCCATMHGKRQGEFIECSLIDVGMPAFGVLFTRSSFLEFQMSPPDQTARDKARTLFGAHEIPSANLLATCLTACHLRMMYVVVGLFLILPFAALGSGFIFHDCCKLSHGHGS